MLITFLQDVKDFRRPQARRYELHNVLLFSILALLCNAKSYRDIHRFMKVHFENLKKEFSLSWERPPGYTTIRNIIIGVDSLELEAAFRAYTQSLVNYYTHPVNSETYIQIAIDGKVLCGSFDNFNDKKAIQQLMFFDVAQRLILGHITIPDKTNEIPTLQTLIEELKLTGVIYSADAIHCQKKLLKPALRTMPCLYRSKTIKNICSKMLNNSVPQRSLMTATAMSLNPGTAV